MVCTGREVSALSEDHPASHTSTAVQVSVRLGTDRVF